VIVLSLAPLVRCSFRTDLDRLGHHLHMDSGESEISKSALQLIAGIHERTLGTEALETFQIKRTLVTLARRDGDFIEAEWLALDLMSSTSAIYGAINERARSSMTELVHVLKDQGKYIQALELCQDVLRRGQQDLGAQFPDARNIYVLEDMAELTALHDQMPQSIAWLSKAHRAAITTWGESDPSTVYIRQKLDAALMKNEKDTLTQLGLEPAA